MTTITMTVPLAARRPTLLERLCGVLASAAARWSGRLLAQSNRLRAIAARSALEDQALQLEQRQLSHVPRGDGGRFRKRDRAAEQYSASDLAWFRSPAKEVE